MKFRIWDEETKYLDYDVRITNTDKYEKVEVLDGFSSWREVTKPNYSLMRSIGLKDKNNSEIYEHDVLKIQTYDLCSKKINDEYLGVVCFSKGGFFVLTDKYHRDFCLWGVGTGTMEVIGNIHENPELLDEVEE